MKRSELINKTATVLESTLPRLMDAVLVLALLRGLVPENVGLIERSQAIVVPIMLLFLSPEQLLYKKFSTWKREGPGAHVGRVRSLRRFCWLKGFAGYLLAFLFSIRAAGVQPALLCAFLWAFSRTLAPQVIGIDREYLRINGKMGRAFALVFAQKLLFLGGTLAVLLLRPASMLADLAAVGVGSVTASGILAFVFTSQLDSSEGGTESVTRQKSHSAWSEIRTVVQEALVRFSLWTHVNYVAANTIETMDVLVLGVLGFPNRAIGIYGAAVRVANFSMALPTALTMWFSVRLGQATRNSDLRTKLSATARPSLKLLALISLQTTALVVLAPFLANILGTTRWTASEKLAFAQYLVPLSLGVGIYSLSIIVMTWLKYCCDVKAIFWRISFPWLVLSAALYFYMGSKGEVLNLARANVACYAMYSCALLLFMQKAPLEADS